MTTGEFDQAAREAESMPTIGDTKTASTLLSLEGQGVARSEVNKDADAVDIKDGSGFRGIKPADVATVQGIENTCFATQLLQEHMKQMQVTIDRIPATV